jgi:hypothetical protein
MKMSSGFKLFFIALYRTVIQKLNKSLFVGQNGLVPAGKNLIVGFGQGIFNKGFAFIFTKYNANGFVFIIRFPQHVCGN